MTFTSFILSKWIILCELNKNKFIWEITSSNPQAPFLSYQLISVALHGSGFHPTAVYISDLVEHTILLPKMNIPPYIMMDKFTCQAPGYLCTEELDWSWFYLLSLRRIFFPCGFFLVPCIKQLLCFSYNGWPMILVMRAHNFSKLAFKGGVRIIILPCAIWSIMSKLGVLWVYI